MIGTRSYNKLSPLTRRLKGSICYAARVSLFHSLVNHELSELTRQQCLDRKHLARQEDIRPITINIVDCMYRAVQY